MPLRSQLDSVCPDGGRDESSWRFEGALAVSKFQPIRPSEWNIQKVTAADTSLGMAKFIQDGYSARLRCIFPFAQSSRKGLEAMISVAC